MSSPVSFNWDAGVALSADEDESWTVAINDHTLDELSYQLALAIDVAAANKNIMTTKPSMEIPWISCAFEPSEKRL
jgi:hypothetical protein